MRRIQVAEEDQRDAAFLQLSLPALLALLILRTLVTCPTFLADLPLPPYHTLPGLVAAERKTNATLVQSLETFYRQKLRSFKDNEADGAASRLVALILLLILLPSHALSRLSRLSLSLSLSLSCAGSSFRRLFSRASAAFLPLQASYHASHQAYHQSSQEPLRLRLFQILDRALTRAAPQPATQ